MKKNNWILVVLLLVTLEFFVGYQQIDKLRTDTKPPQISIDDSKMLEISVAAPKEDLLQGVSATDARDGDVSRKLVVEGMQLINRDGLIEVAYAVADQAGNVAKAERKVCYTDYESPKFSLTAPLIYAEHENIDIMQDVFATDVLDGDIQHRIRATSMTSDAISNLGVHDIHLQVTNSLGDTSELVIPVEVLEKNTYEATLFLTDYLIYLPQGSEFQPRNYLDSFEYKSKTVDLSGSVPTDYAVAVKSDVDVNVPGVYTVEYRVTYIVRHATNPDFDQKFTGYSKLIVVVEG